MLANPKSIVPITKFIQDTGRFTQESQELNGRGRERGEERRKRKR